MGWLDEPKPKKAIPKDVRLRVWEKYFPGVTVGKCYVCKEAVLHRDFQCGHNKADAKGGTLHISNLRVICGGCNRAMKTTSIEVYKARHYGKPKNKDTKPKGADDGLAALEMKVRKYLTTIEYKVMSSKHGFDVCAKKEVFLEERYLAVELNQMVIITATSVRDFMNKTVKFSKKMSNIMVTPEVQGMIAYTGELPKDIASLVKGSKPLVKFKKF